MKTCRKLAFSVICLVHFVLASDKELSLKLINVTIGIFNPSIFDVELKHYQLYSLSELKNNLVLANATTIWHMEVFKQNGPILRQEDIPYMPTLYRLWLVSDNIEEIQSRTFQKTAAVEHIYLSDNLLKEIKDDVFSNLINLWDLDLSQNLIARISPHSFDNLTNLRSINLSNNRLTFWDKKWFSNVPNLQLISFAYNLLEEIPNEAFVNFLDDRTKGPTSSIAGPFQMIFFLNGNKIRKIGSDIFKGIEEVDLFSVGDNQITVIDNNAFRGLKRIRDIQLQGNQLVNVNENLFQRNITMLRLNLTHNKIHQCFDSYLDKFFVAEFTLLEGNPLHCKCIDKIFEWNKEHSWKSITTSRCHDTSSSGAISMQSTHLAIMVVIMGFSLSYTLLDL